MWQIYFYLFLEALLPVGLSVFFYLLIHFTKFKNIPYIYRQIIIGILFGGVAIFGTEVGVNVNDVAVANIRDTGPLVAGLIFGGPAGIIAGFIGGIERFLAAYWGRGYYSQIACSISTILAGFIAAFLRKKMFENKTPNILSGFAVGLVMEALHLTILFLTHLSEPNECLVILKVLTLPMLLANATGVGLSCFAIKLLSRKDKENQYRTLNKRIQIWLLLLVISAYGLTTGFVSIIQNNYGNETANRTLNLNVNDIGDHVLEYSNMMIETRIEAVESIYLNNPDLTVEQLLEQSEGTVDQINLISLDNGGDVLASTNPNNVGFNMMNDPKASEQSRDFQGHMEYLHYYAQKFNVNSISEVEYIKYAGKVMPFKYNNREFYLQIGINAHTFYDSGVSSVVNIFTSHRHVYYSGFLIVLDLDDMVISDTVGKKGDINLSGELLETLTPFTRYRRTIYSTDCYFSFQKEEAYYFIACVPTSDITDSIETMIYANSFIQIIIYGLIFALAYILIEKLVVNNIKNINETLDLIIDGDLNQRVKSNRTYEFNELSTNINITVDTLKRYIEQAASRIDKELEFAKKIQASALPSAFPAFPTRKDFNIYAAMFTAKQVGGDFYDFYMLERDVFAFLIADVSGKGIPASMFMMESKTMLKNLAVQYNNVGEIFEIANNNLCQGNSANMFVTCWMGIIDLKKGVVQFANAGHNAPLIYRKEEGYYYLTQKKNVVLAGFPGLKYETQEIILKPGDRIYLYTDGVTEATSENNELYGEERLLNYLNAHQELVYRDLINGIKNDIDLFVGDANQFDDITMLLFEYFGNK